MPALVSDTQMVASSDQTPWGLALPASRLMLFLTGPVAPGSLSAWSRPFCRSTIQAVSPSDQNPHGVALEAEIITSWLGCRAWLLSRNPLSAFCCLSDVHRVVPLDQIPAAWVMPAPMRVFRSACAFQP